MYIYMCIYIYICIYIYGPSAAHSLCMTRHRLGPCWSLLRCSALGSHAGTLQLLRCSNVLSCQPQWSQGQFRHTCCIPRTCKRMYFFTSMQRLLSPSTRDVHNWEQGQTRGQGCIEAHPLEVPSKQPSPAAKHQFQVCSKLSLLIKQPVGFHCLIVQLWESP